MASRQERMKQYRRAYYVKNQELLGMRVRQYRQLDDCKIACPLCQSIVSKVNMSTHKKTRKCKQLRYGKTASNYRKTIQTVRIFDGVNAEPRVVKYEIYTYGPEAPCIKGYDILNVINKSEPSVGSSAASPAAGGAGVDDVDVDDDDADDSDADDDAFSAAAAAAAGATSA